MQDELIFKPISEEELDEVERIEKESFSEAWSRDAFLDAIGSKFHRIYCLKQKDCESERLLGYIGWTSVAGEAEITNVAIDGKFRRRGYGAVLMERALSALEGEGNDKVFLEVRAGNVPAVGLYEKFGFREIGIRKNFYRFPTEDARLMVKILKNQ